jgi:hypothetical protein
MLMTSPKYLLILFTKSVVHHNRMPGSDTSVQSSHSHKVMHTMLCSLQFSSLVSQSNHAPAVIGLAACPIISLPSQNLGSSFPGTKCLSTLSFVITHIRIVPPDDPSRAIASARAICQYSGLDATKG